MTRHRQYIIIDRAALAILQEMAKGPLDKHDIEPCSDGRFQVWVDGDVFVRLLDKDPSEEIKRAYRTGRGW